MLKVPVQQPEVLRLVPVRQLATAPRVALQVPELARMSDEEVNDYRKELNGIKCRGKNVPKPVKNWNQVGLSTRALDLLRKNGFDKPMPIQVRVLGSACGKVSKHAMGGCISSISRSMSLGGLEVFRLASTTWHLAASLSETSGTPPLLHICFSCISQDVPSSYHSVRSSNLVVA